MKRILSLGCFILFAGICFLSSFAECGEEYVGDLVSASNVINKYNREANLPDDSETHFEANIHQKFIEFDNDFDDESMVTVNSLKAGGGNMSGASMNILESSIKDLEADPAEDLARSIMRRDEDGSLDKEDGSVTGPEKMGRQRLGKINPKTGKPYGVVAMICLRCHNGLHLAHPLEVESTKAKIPMEASFPLGAQGTGLTCISCHVKMNKNYKYLRWPTEGGKKKQLFCVRCHAKEGKKVERADYKSRKNLKLRRVRKY